MLKLKCYILYNVEVLPNQTNKLNKNVLFKPIQL